MQHRAHTVLDSPVGPLTLVATDGGLAGLYMVEHRHRPPIETFGDLDPEPFAAVAAQLEEYFEGRRATGVEYVLVNGKVVLDRGRHTRARPGAILYGQGKR